jgi:hypothetical protein
MTRAEQLRAAKNRQRLRQRREGLAEIQLRMKAEEAERLRAALHAPHFREELDKFLRDVVLDLHQWPALRELAWNRAGRWIPAEDAFALYERNWRFVDEKRLTKEEGRLIERLRNRYGGGVLNA